LVNPNIDGWERVIFSQPLCSKQVWPNIFPPNHPPKAHVPCLQSIASHVIHTPPVTPQRYTSSSRHASFAYQDSKRPRTLANPAHQSSKLAVTPLPIASEHEQNA